MDALLNHLRTLHTALKDPNTWELEPLVVECEAAMALREVELGKRLPPRASARQHGVCEPIILEPGELWP